MHDARLVGAGYVGHLRSAPGSNDHGVRSELDQLVGRHLVAEHELHAQLRELRLEVRSVVAQVAAVRIERKHGWRASDRSAPVREIHGVSSQRRDTSGLHARGAGADHYHGLARLGGRDGHLVFTCGRRVHRGRQRHAVRTDRVTLRESEARPDLLGPTARGLVGQVRICDEGPHHADQIGGALGEDALGMRRIGDPSGDRDRYVDRPPDRRRGRDVESRFDVPGTHVRALHAVTESGVVAAAHTHVGHVW